MSNLIQIKYLAVIVILLLLVTSFSGSTDLKDQKYSRLNPAVVQISLSKPDTLGKIIDNDFSILKINKNLNMSCD